VGESKTYAARYGFQAAMIGTAKGNLPAKAGPGANQGEIEAVQRNNDAAYFLTVPMLDSMLLSVAAAGESDPAWPDHLKAHLMIAYLKRWYDVDAVEEDVDVEAEGDVEDDVENDDVEEDDDTFICRFDVEEGDMEEDDDVENEEEKDDDTFICRFDVEEDDEEDDDVFIERLSNTVGVKYSDVVRHANEEAGSKEEEEDDDSFIEWLSNMVDLTRGAWSTKQGRAWRAWKRGAWRAKQGRAWRAWKIRQE
jgi:hypothetical protein